MIPLSEVKKIYSDRNYTDKQLRTIRKTFSDLVGRLLEIDTENEYVKNRKNGQNKTTKD